MLFQHEASEPIGVWRELREDKRGLYVRGEILAEGPRGRTALSLVRSGAIDGLSIGFRTRRFSGRSPRGRELIELDLWEVSIVTFPMLPQARLRLVSQPALAA
jgi:HK97 family phage prohead protease